MHLFQKLNRELNDTILIEWHFADSSDEKDEKNDNQFFDVQNY